MAAVQNLYSQYIANLVPSSPRYVQCLTRRSFNIFLVVTVLRYKEGVLHYQTVLVTQSKVQATGRVQAALIIAVWRVTVNMNGTGWKEKVRTWDLFRFSHVAVARCSCLIKLHLTLNDWSRREPWILFRENLNVSRYEGEVTRSTARSDHVQQRWTFV